MAIKGAKDVKPTASIQSVLQALWTAIKGFSKHFEDSRYTDLHLCFAQHHNIYENLMLELLVLFVEVILPDEQAAVCPD